MAELNQRKLLIRALVITSLALLLAGAVTPLLSTERFYFFSNTFSLASGLRQLVASQQALIALVIGIFSICIPVIKSCVIWLATASALPRRRLLAAADRFGKWSMLEVFIAALVIVALKLGPVVDATLHYGAYLLAGSVLASGIASQLLVHEPHSGPLISGAATLTIGAVGGAVLATLLIGMMNPGLFRLEAVIGSPESRCAQRVLQLELVHAAASRSEADYASSLRQIDATGCSEAFRVAFSDYTEAWRQLAAQPADAGDPGWLERASRRLGLIATRDNTLEKIEQAWAEVARIALEHGVTAPPR